MDLKGVVEKVSVTTMLPPKMMNRWTRLCRCKRQAAITSMSLCCAAIEAGKWLSAESQLIPSMNKRWILDGSMANTLKTWCFPDEFAEPRCRILLMGDVNSSLVSLTVVSWIILMSSCPTENCGNFSKSLSRFETLEITLRITSTHFFISGWTRDILAWYVHSERSRNFYRPMMLIFQLARSYVGLLGLLQGDNWESLGLLRRALATLNLLDLSNCS